MSKLTLSLVIPAFNEEHHLKDCLDSIAKQTVMPNEVLVIDNNSTDNTVKIAESYPFVTVLHEEQQGVINVRNKGFNTAKGDIIGRTDADNLLKENWVERVLELFSDETIAAATGPMFFYDMPLKEDNTFAEHLFKGSLYKYDKNFPFLAGNNMAIRKSAWDTVKEHTCRNNTIHEDIDLAIHLSRGGHNIVYDADVIAGTSARRYDDPPLKFLNYMKMMTRTFKHHQMNPVGAHIAEAAYSLGYVSLWPLRRSYNPKTKKRSLKHLIRGNNPRKNPMSER